MTMVVQGFRGCQHPRIRILDLFAGLGGTANGFQRWLVERCVDFEYVAVEKRRIDVVLGAGGRKICYVHVEPVGVVVFEDMCSLLMREVVLPITYKVIRVKMDYPEDLRAYVEAQKYYKRAKSLWLYKVTLVEKVNNHGKEKD